MIRRPRRPKCACSSGTGTVYVGIICYDSDPSKIIVSQSRRDATLTDTDSVILVFDTFNDSQNAFVFGTNPLGIEYDGQVSGEGQTGGTSFGTGGGSGGSQRGGISAFNPNWDGDWTVRAGDHRRGWEAELAIPLKTLRYRHRRRSHLGLQRDAQHPPQERAGVSRGDSARASISIACRWPPSSPSLDLPGRRDIKLIPYALASANKDYTLRRAISSIATAMSASM